MIRGWSVRAENIHNALQRLAAAKIVRAADYRPRRRIDFVEFVIFQWIGPPLRIAPGDHQVEQVFTTMAKRQIVKISYYDIETISRTDHRKPEAIDGDSASACGCGRLIVAAVAQRPRDLDPAVRTRCHPEDPARLRPVVLYLFAGPVCRNPITAALADDPSMIGAFSGIRTIGLIHIAELWLKNQSDLAGRIIDGTPVVFENGQFNRRRMTRPRLNQQDVMAAARQRGLMRVEQVRYAGELNATARSPLPKTRNERR